MDTGRIMDDLFDAFARQDAQRLRELCADDFAARRNGSPSVGFDDMIALVRAAFWEPGITSSYSEIRRVVEGRSIAEQHVVTLTTPDGRIVQTDVCVVVHIDEDGLVYSFDEYADGTVLAELMS